MGECDRIYLKPIAAEHTKLIVRWRNNENVYHNFIFSEPFTEAMHQNWLESQVKTGQVAQFIIYVKESDIPIGSVYFRDIDYKAGVAEYGIFIGEDDYIGKGYGTEAAVLALQYAFETMTLQKVFVRVFADNIADVRSYDKVGFEQTDYREHAVEKDGIMRDLIFMSCRRQIN